MVMSILHRATGVALAVGSFMIAAWLMCIASGAANYESMASLLASLPGQIALAGFSAALVYHLLNGIRHLLWDIGYGYEIPKVYATGWTVLVLAVVLTAAIWVLAARNGGMA